jgi:hypothetical protein|nr:hypothetical protein [uncultured Oscillibacter sp.]
MDIERYTINGREAALYMAGYKGSPLIVLNNYSEDGRPVMKNLKEIAVSQDGYYISLLSPI